jgi:hypothetical protein
MLAANNFLLATLKDARYAVGELTPQRVGNDRSAKGPVTFAPVEVPSLNTERQKIHVEKVFQCPFFIYARLINLSWNEQKVALG